MEVKVTSDLREDIVRNLVQDIRCYQPKIGGKKLYYLLKDDLDKLPGSIGRDKFFDILRKLGLLVKRRKKYVSTTDSYHRFHKYKNKLKGKLLTGPNQAYVCDITYLRTRGSFVYLFLQTDAYSRMITGWSLSHSLSIEGAIEALKMTIKQSKNMKGSIHHSDRGIQYCSKEYVRLLKKQKVQQNANNNLFVLADTSLFVDNGSNHVHLNFAAWKTLSGKDVFSYFASPAVIPSSQFFVDKSTGNLDIDTTKNICWYANGKALPFSGIKADFDSSDIRSDIIQNGATDIGSDEFKTSTIPPLLTVYGNHKPGGADTLSCNQRILAIISWGSNGTLPTLGDCRWYSGVWPNDTTNNGTVISANYFNAYWSIPATGGNNYTYSLKLFYDQSILGKITSPENMVINKKQINVPGTWIVITPTIINTSEESLTINGQTTFSEFTATDLLHSLPISLVLNGQQVNNDIRLSWQDPNADYTLSYEIERSTDGITFAGIGNITANNGTNYQYTDAGILKNTTVIFYRLRIINNTNKLIYTNIISFRDRAGNEEEITKVYPNPFTKQISLEINSDRSQVLSLQLFSANGNTITKSELKIAAGKNLVSLNIPNNISPGTYLLQVKSQKKSYSFKVVKK